MTAQLAGTATLVRTLAAASDQLGSLDDADAKAAQLIASVAAGLAPRRTGVLAGTVRAAVVGGRATVTFGGTRAVYAPVIHWGWPKRRIRANEFASRAAQQTEPQWVEYYAADVAKVIDTIKGT